jgi:AcrR family transcriptional regulator
MGHSHTEKLATHQRIVDVAAKRFREVGFEGIGVADIMTEAGLTVGGFYRHFESGDELVVEALIAALSNLGAWEHSKPQRRTRCTYSPRLHSPRFTPPLAIGAVDMNHRPHLSRGMFLRHDQQPTKSFTFIADATRLRPLFNSQWVGWRVKYGRQPGEANT